MNGGTSFLRPGKVVEVVDTKGTIKCTCPGLFSTEDNVDLLPPVIPFCEWGGSSSFSSPLIDDTVWIFHDVKNTQLFYYLKYNVLDQQTRKILEDGDKNVEVLFSRDTDEGIYQMFFSDGQGIKFLHDESYIKISPKGDIELVTGNSNRSISISKDSICLGKSAEDSDEVKTHVALGERTEDCLQDIYNILSLLKDLMSSNPYTASLCGAFTNLSKLSSDISKVTSNNVKTV